MSSSFARPTWLPRPALPSLWAGLVGPACATLAVLTILGLSPDFPLLAQMVPTVLAVYAVVLVLWRPWTALAIGVVAPILQMSVGHSLVTPSALGLLAIAIVRGWPASDLAARQGASLIAALGLSTVLIGIGFAETAPGSEGIAWGVGYAVMTGIAAVIIRPSPSLIALCVALVASIASIAALATPALGAARNTMVLGENANGIGLLASLGLVAGLTLVRRLGVGRRLIGGAATALCTAGLVASGSRGGLIAALAGCAVVLMHRYVTARPAKAVLVLGVTVTALVLATGPLMNLFLRFVGRDQAGAEANIVARQSSVLFAVEQGLSHPLTGVGLGQLSQVSRTNPESGLGLRAHNVFAGVFAETGLLTLALLLALSLLALLRSRRYAPRTLTPLVVTILANGLSLEWWGATRTGPVALLILGAALTLKPADDGQVMDHPISIWKR